MMRRLMKGNEAVVCGALFGGATHFFGYPITPASEIAHAAATWFPKLGHEFLQAESEVAAVNMLYGAASAGARVMTASSGPGVALMSEGISYMAGAELPCVIVDIQRAGPGLGNIWPEQSDYNMVVKGGGHGNYRSIVFAPNSVQEMCDMAFRAFEIADEYRMTVFILADAYIGQMMEPVAFPETVAARARKDWAVYGDEASRGNLISSIHMSTHGQAQHNINLQTKYEASAVIADSEHVGAPEADTVIVAFGIASRVALSAVQSLQREGASIALFRPKTLFPYPEDSLLDAVKHARRVVVFELNNGQMADDVDRIIGTNGRSRNGDASGPVRRYNWYGGVVPSAAEVIEKLKGDIDG
ncbi:MAG: 3-methyl-2-oxobutanoate dehydrogenase subunit VorB [Spirochaetaceae bacterium]|nr:MAG: 3-methyl-2-oxobutanoate dehydrogenase subunit VorB [Spirochaetaceae bacterium]